MDSYLQRRYEHLLSLYSQGAKPEYRSDVELLSRLLLEQRVPPEEFLRSHIEATKKLLPHLSSEVHASFDLLTEMMDGYSGTYQSKGDLVTQQKEMQYELELAVAMQNKLLPDQTPTLKGLEIGVISAAIKQMSGDYYNFVDHGVALGIAMADIIGKGMPAALGMSLIKYAMDHLDEQRLSPAEMLRGLNKVVERNVDPGMFITMIYGVYDTMSHQFCYATAGHEPGFFYRAKEDRFVDMESKGLVLGVEGNVDYAEYTLKLEPQDAIILFTDGATECRVDGRFMERDGLRELIRTYIHLPAQQGVEAIHRKLLEMTHYQMRDDHTILIIKCTKQEEKDRRSK